MKFFRSQRVGNLIREELSKIIMKELEFSDVLLTITDVEISEKLRRAIVNFSILPSDESERILRILNGFKKMLQFKLHRKINIRPMPEIVFKIDYVIKNAAAIEKALIEDKE